MSEKDVLTGILGPLREAIVAKATGVPEPQVRTAGVPSGTSLLGLVRHLTFVERFSFLGEDLADWRRSWRVGPDETADEVIGGYRAAVAAADAVIAGWVDLDEPSPRPARRGGVPSRRWMLAHMIDETGRHAGHADILRELIDADRMVRR